MTTETILQRAGRLNANLETATRLHQFFALAKCVALSRGIQSNAVIVAKENRLKDPVEAILAAAHRVYELSPRLQKVAAEAGTSVGWGEELSQYQQLATAFAVSLQNFSAFDQMLPSMVRVPLRTKIVASTSAAAGSTPQEAAPKPISSINVSGDTLLERKALAILVISQELARFDWTGGNLFRTELSNAVAVATDQKFVEILAAGVTPISASGTTAEAVRQDLRTMLGSITTGARSRLFLLTTSAIAKALAVMTANAGDAAFPSMNYNGGSIGGIEAVVSDGVPSGQMILADASQVAGASEAITLSASDQASVQLDSAPDSPPSASTNLVSLWQNNLLGLRAERFFGAAKLTSTGVAVLENANYSGDSP